MGGLLRDTLTTLLLHPTSRACISFNVAGCEAALSRVNLKTAQALGLTIPPALLARADEVIE